MNLLEKLEKGEKIIFKHVDFAWSTADKLFENLDKQREKNNKELWMTPKDREDLKKVKFTI